MSQTPDPISGIEHAARTDWNEFPDVIIANFIAAVKHNAAYRAAKAGDIPAAMRLVDDTLSTETVNRVIAALKGRAAIVQPVHALEAEGINRIPSALAEALEGRLGPRAVARVGTEIVQVNNAGHTGASGWHRIANPAVFDGIVEQGMAYLLADDFVGKGAPSPIYADTSSPTGARFCSPLH